MERHKLSTIAEIVSIVPTNKDADAMSFVEGVFSNVTQQVQTLVDREVTCACTEQLPKLVNYDAMWHDGDIICENCGGYIRGYDAG